MSERNSQPVNSFRGRELPEPARWPGDRFPHQTGGRLSLRARSREFAALTDPEVAYLERMYAETFAGVVLP